MAGHLYPEKTRCMTRNVANGDCVGATFPAKWMRLVLPEVSGC